MRDLGGISADGQDFRRDKDRMVKALSSDPVGASKKSWSAFCFGTYRFLPPFLTFFWSCTNLPLPSSLSIIHDG